MSERREWHISFDEQRIISVRPGVNQTVPHDSVHVVDARLLEEATETLEQVHATNKILEAACLEAESEYANLCKFTNDLEAKLEKCRMILKSIETNPTGVKDKIEFQNSWTRWAKRIASETLKQVFEHQGEK